MEHRNGDDTARFLRELRQLRDGAGLGHAELAARAHYPYDSIRAAEVGPSLPDLPVLCAFVRACGGTAEEWEERWRSLTRSPSLPVSAARQSGHSDASAAGARIGSAAQAADSPDPSIIMAALNRVAEEMASPGVSAPPTSAFSAPTIAAPLPDLPRPPSSPPPGEPADGAKRPTGWDPIRVSSAWPTLKATPAMAEPTRAHPVPEFAGGPGTSQGTAPGAKASSGAVPTRAVRLPTPGSGIASGAGESPGATHQERLSARTKMVVAAAVLLCVLAGLLVAFA